MSGQTESLPKGEQPKRRPYQAPQLGRVDLKADEVLGVGCKMSSGFGAGSPLGCVVAHCSQKGS
jgi:hypothetical protein